MQDNAMLCSTKKCARFEGLFSSAHGRASALVAHLEHASVLAAVRNASIAVDDAEAQDGLDLAIECSVAGYNERLRVRWRIECWKA